MRYTLHHKTEYLYNDRVSYSQHLAHLKPITTERQRLVSYKLSVSPNTESYTIRQNYFGNFAEYFSILLPHQHLEISAYSEVDVFTQQTPLLQRSLSWEEVRDTLQNPILLEDKLASEFCHATKHCPKSRKIADFAKAVFTKKKEILQSALEFNTLIHEELTFDPNATSVTSSVEQVFERRAGVCQDYAHLQITALRSLGLAAKYVSGYIRTDPPAGKPRLIGADASHAWISLYIPTLGWVEYDSTNNVIPSTNHITVAYGRDYDDICPIRGIVYGGGAQSLQVGVTVTPQDSELSASDIKTPNN